MTTQAMKQHVVQHAKQAYEEGLFAGTSGNLSIRDPKTSLVAITPTSLPYPGLHADDIVLMTVEGKGVEGKHNPSNEWRMHTRLYQLREDIHAIVHTHSPYATAFAVVHKPIPVTLIEMVFFLYGDVPLAEYQRPGSAELADAAYKVLHNRTACLMANHGVLAVGDTLDRAHIRAVYVEDAAKITSRALVLGEAVPIPLKEQNAIRRSLGIPEE